MKVFSATLLRDRAQLGERITEWISSNRIRVVDLVVRQSSDASFHCLSVIVFYRS